VIDIIVRVNVASGIQDAEFLQQIRAATRGFFSPMYLQVCYYRRRAIFQYQESCSRPQTTIRVTQDLTRAGAEIKD